MIVGIGPANSGNQRFKKVQKIMCWTGLREPRAKYKSGASKETPQSRSRADRVQARVMDESRIS